MNPYEIIDKYYPENTQQRQILVIHSLAVSGKAMKMLDAHPELRLNRSFVKEAALLHDIGIFQTDAPTIQCFGTHPYIAHGYLGAEILRAEGFPQHALVCERHTEPDFRWKISLPSNFLFLIARCCPSPWKNN